MTKVDATNSVLSYIKSPEGRETVILYLKKRAASSGNLRSAKPNYSEMLSMLDLQTTKDGVPFNSTYVNRSRITEEIGKFPV